jgi:hypothetical protein
VERRRRATVGVRDALMRASAGHASDVKVVSSRYGRGLQTLDPAAVDGLLNRLSAYVEAVDQALDVDRT